MQRVLISSGSPWEEVVGYSRAVRVGPLVEVAGTTAVENGEVVAPNDVYQQSICIFKKIEIALQEAGATLEQVVRTRAYITDMRQWEAFGKAHAQVFGTIKPAATLVQVAALINPQLVIEIEATAYVD